MSKGSAHDLLEAVLPFALSVSSLFHFLLYWEVVSSTLPFIFYSFLRHINFRLIVQLSFEAAGSALKGRAFCAVT